MVGGFLGAGKTTTILQLAQRYRRDERRVGVVTNDQAAGLVDTQLVQHAGFDVSEIAGGCFCCRFDELAEATAALGAELQPDVILAEPVGSCTDLAATVLEPLRRYHGDFELGPLVVLVKPEHGRRILLEDEPLGVSREAAYIFEKQIEEADVIAVNKIDRLSELELTDLLGALSDRFPSVTTLAISAREGRGLDELYEATRDLTSCEKEFMQLDYDRYAEGEADLGWFNGSYELQADALIELDDFACEFIRVLARRLQVHLAEPAHIKVAVQSEEGALAVANLVAAHERVELALRSSVTARRATLTLNARVVISPGVLAECVEIATQRLAERYGVVWRMLSQQAFEPGRPEPTHQFR